MKRILSLVIALTLMLVAIPFAQAEEPVTIHMYGQQLTIPEDDPILPIIEEKLNIKIITESTGGDESLLIARIAGGDIPDVFRVTTIGHLKEYYDNEVLLNLTPYMDQLPNIVSLFEESDWARVTFDGDVYAIPRRGEKNYSCWYIRYDWMDKLGVKDPATFDELLELAIKMNGADLDGNGKADTYAISGTYPTAFEGFYSAYGMAAPENVLIRDGKAVLTATQPEFKLALQEIRKFVEAGVVDPEIVSNTNATRTEKMATGKSGIVYGGWSSFSKLNAIEELKAVDPNAKWGPMHVEIETDYGKAGAYQSACGYNAVYAINADLVDQPEVLDAVLRMFNYIASDEGDMLLSFGIEGVHYELGEDGTVIKLPEMDNLTYAYAIQFTGRQDMKYCMTKFAHCADIIEYCANELPIVYHYTAYIEPPEDYNVNDLSSYVKDQVAQFIFGSRSMDEYDVFVDTLYKSFDLQTYLDAGTEQLTALGFIK